MKMAQAMNTAAAAQGKCLRVHIKIDTGMGRIAMP